MRLVDSDAAIQVVNKIIDDPKDTMILFAAHCTKRLLEEMPTVDAVPVIHSRWIWITEDKYRCENCGDETRVDEVMEVPKYEWCPFCGARMDQKMIR